MAKKKPAGELIVALDVPDLKTAAKFVKKLYKYVKVFKVGSQLFCAAGPQVLSMIHKKRRRVFLDLKLHDIPTTVGRAVEVLTGEGVFMLNMHTSGGRQMMKEAVSAARRASKKKKAKRPLLIGVTVLTSMDESDLAEFGMRRFVKDQVLQLARFAKESGLDGVVASAQEAKRIKQICGKDFLVIAPGIRPSGAKTDDQKRVMTPKEAIEEGADYIVVGRPIVESKTPVRVVQKILKDITN